MNLEIESYEDQYARAWSHKQQLDRLVSFSDRLQYWLKNIDAFPANKTYVDKENTSFVLSVAPKTVDDWRKLNQYYVDYYREMFFKENKQINKFAWQWNEADKEKVAFTVRSFESLKTDLERRLRTATRQKDLLDKELSYVVDSINFVGRNVNGVNSTLSNEIKELRYYLETNRVFDFDFSSSDATKAVRLADVWDIIHFEAYLKDLLVTLQHGLLPPSDKLNEDFTPITSTPMVPQVEVHSHAPQILSPPTTTQEIRPFPNLLVGNYSEDDLNRLLIHLRMKNDKGQTLWPQGKKSGLYGVIDALAHKGYLIETTLIERMSSLSIYLGLKEGRPKNGYSKVQSQIKEKSLSFLNQVIKKGK